MKLLSSEKATLRALSNTMNVNQERTVKVDYFEKEIILNLGTLKYFKINKLIKVEDGWEITFTKLK